MLYFLCWIVALSTHDLGAAEATDAMKPPGWVGNFWGPAAYRARLRGALPPLPTSPAMAGWKRWGRATLQTGDIVFRLGDARAARGILALSRFIARATGSPFSHTGIVAIEHDSPVVYDCSAAGIQRQPFEVWMLDCVGAFGVKRLKLEHRDRIPGVLEFCRSSFDRQIPFDFGFRMDDQSFYCLELTEKAFRSQGLALSEPVRIGDWQNLPSYALTALAIPPMSGLVLDRPITLEQTVYLPGNEHQGVWSSQLLETVHSPGQDVFDAASPSASGQLSMRGDLELIAFAATVVHRSYSELPARFLMDLVLQPRFRGLLAARGLKGPEVSLNDWEP
jgi:hypothetical protein